MPEAAERLEGDIEGPNKLKPRSVPQQRVTRASVRKKRSPSSNIVRLVTSPMCTQRAPVLTSHSGLGALNMEVKNK